METFRQLMIFELENQHIGKISQRGALTVWTTRA